MVTGRIVKGQAWRCVRWFDDEQAAIGWIADRTGLPREFVAMDLEQCGWIEDGEPGAGDAFFRVVRS